MRVVVEDSRIMIIDWEKAIVGEKRNFNLRRPGELA